MAGVLNGTGGMDGRSVLIGTGGRSGMDGLGPVAVLTGMKLTVLRRSMSSPRAASLVLGAVTGTLAAVATALLGLLHFATPEAGVGVIAAVLLLWTAGWALGPTVTGGDPTLRLDYFALVPQPPRRLALGLLGASFAGIIPLVGLLAFTVLAVFGARFGPVPALVAVPAMLLHLLFVVVLSKLAVQGLGSAARTRLGWELSALLVGLVSGFLNTGWFAIGFFLKLLTGEWADGVGTAVRILPSGWSVVAVDAARRSDWGLVAACLGGLLALSALLFAAWTALLTRQLVRGTAAGRPAAIRGARLRAVPDTPGGAVLGRELRLWARDPRRARMLRMALWTGVFTGLLPLLGGFTSLVPWTGVVAALFAGALCANLYGLDAGALWLTLLVPGAERPDVRARQLAWLLITAPAALLLTLAAGAATPDGGGSWPWALAVLPAVLGAGAGLVPLVSVLIPAPFPDRPGGNPLDGFSDENGDQVRMQSLAVLLLQVLAALPAAGVVLAGTLLDSAPLRWAGVAVGLGSGLLYALLLGARARRRLETHGPELLDVLRKGVRREPEAPEAPEAPEVPEEEDGPARAPRGRTALVGLLTTAGMLAIAPQGAVAMAMAVFAPSNRSWFAALYLPPAWQVPAAAGFLLLGAGCVVTAYRLDRGRRAAERAGRVPS